MRKMTNWILVISTICVLLSSNAFSANTHAPRAVCDEPLLSFGKKSDFERFRHTFIVKNTGDLTLKIADVSSTCGCAKVKVSSKTVPPGETSNIDVEIILAGYRGMLDKHVSLKTNDPENPVLKLYMRGEVIPSLAIEPRHLFFRKLDLTKSALLSSSITYNVKTQFLGSVESDADFLEVSLETLEPGRKYRVTAKTLPPLSAAHSRATVFVKDTQGRRLFTIPVWLQMESKLHVAPVSITVFGTAHGPCVKQVVVRKGTVTQFKIKSAKVSGTDIQVSIHPLKNYGYRIQLDNITPSSELNRKKLVIETDVKGMERIVVPISYRATR